MSTQPYEETHEATDADFRDATDWQLAFEGSDLIRDAIGPTERYTGVEIGVLNRTAFYKSTANEMLAAVELSIQVDMSLRSDPSQAYWHIAKALRTLAVEMQICFGEGQDKTIADVLLSAEPDERGQGWRGVIITAAWAVPAFVLGVVLIVSAAVWIGII